MLLAVFIAHQDEDTAISVMHRHRFMCAHFAHCLYGFIQIKIRQKRDIDFYDAV